MDVELVHLLSRMRRLLGILEDTVRSQPDIESFLRLGLFYEAQKLCAIDGIRVDIEGLLLPLKRTEEYFAVGNYYHEVGNLKKEPITIKALYRIHKTVMEGITRNRCGRIRESAFLMHPQYTSGSAEYNPPLPEQISWLLEDLERFIQMESKMDVLVKQQWLTISLKQFIHLNAEMGEWGEFLLC